jgi:hypothetical protein
MKVLFVMRHPAAVRSLTGVLRLLDARGHRVHLAFGGVKADAHRVLQRLSDECPGLTFGSLPNRGSAGWVRGREGWNRLARRLRLDSDYLRYLEPRYADAPALRARAEINAHPLTRRFARVARRLAGPVGVRALRKTLAAVERCLDPPPHIERFVRDQQPDVLLVPHLARESVQNDYARAAKRLGISTVYPVFSWDNLTNKGLVHELPDLVLVWNELQADEAVELQDIPRERVRVLGAWSYDHWFDWQPSRSRDEFCATVGLRADRPIILYVCSSTFVAPDEAAFIGLWIDALRRRGGVLAEAGVVVRPHPRNTAQWGATSYDDPQVTIWPAHGEEPLETASRQNYFDSIYHSAAVVGINTSAQIEGAVIGRPVHTVLADEFRDTQQGTLHFQYLKADDFGHLEVGRTMDEHLQQLETSVRDGADAAHNERFLRRFVRPLGLDVPATPLYVGVIEELAGRRAHGRDRGPALAPAVRLLLRPLAGHAARRAAAHKTARPIPPDELRAVVRRLRREQVEARVVAGPWLGDEIGELLYWIPFLRWAQAATYGLRDRLAVVARASSAAWYAGIGTSLVHAEEADAVARAASEDAVVVPAAIVESHRDELAARGPSDSPNYLRRRLDFEPLTAPELPDGLQVPDEFLAVRFEPEHAEVARALVVHGPLVGLEGLDRSAQAAVLARSRGFAGTYGVEAYLAVLLGVPAVALIPSAAEVNADDARLASRFLTRPTFGDLHVIGADVPPHEAALRAASLLEAPVEALARV